MCVLSDKIKLRNVPHAVQHGVQSASCHAPPFPVTPSEMTWKNTLGRDNQQATRVVNISTFFPLLII